MTNSVRQKNLAVSLADLQFITTACQRHLRGLRYKLFMFGSRATCSASSKSDLDIIIDAEHPIDFARLAFVKEELENSSLLFPVDVVDGSLLDPAFRKRVMNEAVEIYESFNNNV